MRSGPLSYLIIHKTKLTLMILSKKLSRLIKTLLIKKVQKKDPKMKTKTRPKI